MRKSRRQDYTFSQVPRADIPRSVFNRNHSHKTTFDAGVLIPFYVDEALPGDTFNAKFSVFARMATPIVPLMDNLYMDVFFFAVPNRLVWDNWQKFCGEQDNPGDTTDYVVPHVQSPSTTGWSVGTIYDYMGLPTGVPDLKVSALPFRAYMLCYNEWFRDQNMVDSEYCPTGDGPDTSAEFHLVRRGKRHDYFTSCLPWPQKGPGVEISLGSTAPVVIDPQTAGIPTFKEVATNQINVLETGAYSAPASPVRMQFGVSVPTGTALKWSQSALVADLSNARSATINTLREAFQIQKLLERDARGGTRYVEILKSHFGVTSPDARLQRPEFLGGGSMPVSINPVQQTSGTPNDPEQGYAATPQGNLAAYATVSGDGIGFSKSFVEHSIILGLVSVRAELSYQQGVNRMWTRETRYDFYWPALAHLGEQTVLRREIYADGLQVNDEAVFGYQERWAEYRYHPSLVTGQFRSTYSNPLDFWHLAQHFTLPPVLDEAFIGENPPLARCLAVPSEPAFLFDSYAQVKCARPMPLYSVPGYIDHF